MMTPDDIDVWVGLDVGKSAHHAHALDHDGNTLYDKPLKQDEKAIRTMLGKLSKHGRVLLVVDQPNTIGSLPLTVARNMGIAVAYVLLQFFLSNFCTIFPQYGLPVSSRNCTI